jgi:hypothetical protein
MKASYFFILLASAALSRLSAQVEVTFGPGIEAHVEQYVATAAKSKSKGFRVQLLSLNGPQAKDEAQRAKTLFQRSWPDHAAYMIWDSPNWKLRVGDFRTRLDATLFWKQVHIQFPQAYVVMDEVKPRQEK